MNDDDCVRSTHAVQSADGTLLDQPATGIAIHENCRELRRGVEAVLSLIHVTVSQPLPLFCCSKPTGNTKAALRLGRTASALATMRGESLHQHHFSRDLSGLALEPVEIQPAGKPVGIPNDTVIPRRQSPFNQGGDFLANDIVDPQRHPLFLR